MNHSLVPSTSAIAVKGKSDREIWEHAQQHGFTLVSKDNDFYQRCLLLGGPKLIWLCIGNCTRMQVLNLILKHETDIRSLETAAETILILS